MRSGGLFILLMLLVFAFPRPTMAGNAFTRQGTELRRLEQMVILYQHDNGTYPITDNQSTWYEKLTAGYRGSVVSKETPDGRYPLDWYDYPLIFELPNAANGNQVVIRSVGENGIDDQGALDDWDVRFGPNLGYWYKMNWPAAYRRAWICGALSVVGFIVIMVKIKQTMARIVFVSLWFGLLGGVVLPFGFDTGWGGHSASIDPKWIAPISGVGILVFQGSILLILIHLIRMFMYRRYLQKSGTIPCTKCNYDLRGTIAANIDRCPECGEPVGDGRA